MRIDFTFSSSQELTDICIVGAGPVGIAMALACAEEGLSVSLIESGAPDKNYLALADIVSSKRHAPMGVVSRRGLGGTSAWWGGRCVAFDDIDFVAREFAGVAQWPLRHEDIKPWYEMAAAFYGIGAPRFSTPSKGWDKLNAVTFSGLERWAPKKNMAKRHFDELVANPRIRLDQGLTAVGMEIIDGGVRGIVVSDGTHCRTLRARKFVLACGGLETTRLLLNVQRTVDQTLFGGSEGALGRYYAGHISGKIADLVLEHPAEIKQHDFFLDEGVYARRRFIVVPEVQQSHGLLNTALWIDNPPFHDATHGNGALSLVWMALVVPLVGRRLVAEGVRVSHTGPKPYLWRRHINNVLGHPISTLKNLIHIVYNQFLRRPRRPGFILRSLSGRYALHYHAEQLPNRDSRVTLGTDSDIFGVPNLHIDFNYGEADVVSVVKTHAILDAALREAELGRLEYRCPQDMLRALVYDQASDGFHQTGTTRMGTSSTDSVVNADCRVHDLSNLYVASSSVFPSSGQANPTFLATALAFRLADHLARTCTPRPKG